MNDPTEEELAEACWRWFADARPHEAYATWPERFWEYFHATCPDITRERMEELLKETEYIP